MKTLTKSFALLITAAAFNACSTPTIDPVKTVQAQTDTTLSTGLDRDVKNQRHPIADESVQAEQTGVASPTPVVVDTRVRKHRTDGTSLEQPISF